MHVTLNGERRELRDGLTVSDLVAELGLAERRIAVELNRAVVSRTEYSRRALRSGDEVEIVHFIGGG
jgi:thiamine biosynthesis protein ThiS